MSDPLADYCAQETLAALGKPLPRLAFRVPAAEWPRIRALVRDRRALRGRSFVFSTSESREAGYLDVWVTLKRPPRYRGIMQKTPQKE